MEYNSNDIVIIDSDCHSCEQCGILPSLLMCVLTSIFLFMLVQITCAISLPFTFCPLFYLCMLCLLSSLCTLLFYTLYVVLLFFLLINMSILFSLFCIYRLHMLTHLFTNAGYKFDINSHYKLLCQTLKISSKVIFWIWLIFTWCFELW